MTSTPPSSPPSTYPNQLMLPGQAAAPEGPCDLNGMYAIHHAFRRDLRRFAAAATATPTGQPAVWAALLERWDRFAHLLHDHHTKEDDVLWPLLHERLDAAGDADGRRVLDDMEAEHGQIDPLLDQTRILLELMAGSPDETTRGRLVDVLDRAGDVLGDHLGHEERDACALLQRYVGAEEWAKVENEQLRGKPSLGEVLYLLPWLAEGLDDATLARLRREAGAAFRCFLRLGRRRFTRLERRAFGYA